MMATAPSSRTAAPSRMRARTATSRWTRWTTAALVVLLANMARQAQASAASMTPAMAPQAEDQAEADRFRDLELVFERDGFVGAPAASPMAGRPYTPSESSEGDAELWRQLSSVSLSPTPLGSSFARINPIYETDDGRDDPVEFLPNVAMNKTCLQSSSSSSAGTFCRLTEDQQLISTASEDSPYIIMDLEKLYYVDHVSFGVNVDEVSEQSKLLVWCTNASSAAPVSDVTDEPYSWKKLVLQNSGNFSMHVHSACSYLRIQRLSFGQLKVHSLRVYGVEIKNRESIGCMAGHDGALCSDHGSCVDNRCQCDLAYGGPACEDYLLTRSMVSSAQATFLILVFVYLTMYYRRRRQDAGPVHALVGCPGESSVFGDEQDLDDADAPPSVASKPSVLAKRGISYEPAVAARLSSGGSRAGESAQMALARTSFNIRATSDAPLAADDPSCTDSLLPSLAPTSSEPQEGVLHLLFASPLIMTGKEGAGAETKHFRPVQGLDIRREYAMLRRSLRNAALSSHGSARNEVPVSVSCATVESFHTLMTLGNARCLHFSGHCTKNFIAFEDGAGQLHSVSMEMLRGLLRSTVTQRSFKTLRLVVLNACNSDAAAREFVLAGVAHVIAYRKRVRDQVAAVFTRSFYLALACGRTVRDAFESAREAVQSSPSFAEDEMDAFVLLPEGDSHREVIWKPSVHEPRPLSRAWPPSDTMRPLPPLCEDFLGRHAAMWSVLRHLTQDRRRLVAVHAETGGAGKTQVALAVAHHLHQRRCATVMRDGIFFVKGVHRRTRGASDSAEAQITEMASLVDELWEAMYPLLSAETPCEQTMQRSVSAFLPATSSSHELDAGFDDFDDFADGASLASGHHSYYTDRHVVSRGAIESMEPLLSPDCVFSSEDDDSDNENKAGGSEGAARRREKLALSNLRRRAIAKAETLARALAQHGARCLVVLDDFRESPLTMSVLQTILEQTSNVRILATSAAPLHLGHTLNVNVVNYHLQPMHAGDAALLFVRHLKRKIVVCGDRSAPPHEATLQEVAQHVLLQNCEGNPREIIHLASDLSSNIASDIDLDAALAATL